MTMSQDYDLCIITQEHFSPDINSDLCPMVGECGHSFTKQGIKYWYEGRKTDDYHKRKSCVPCVYKCARKWVNRKGMPMEEQVRAFRPSNLIPNFALCIALATIRKLKSGETTIIEKEFLQCSLCKNNYSTETAPAGLEHHSRAPVVGICGHTFCASCIYDRHHRAMHYSYCDKLKFVHCPQCNVKGAFHSDRLVQNRSMKDFIRHWEKDILGKGFPYSTISRGPSGAVVPPAEKAQLAMPSSSSGKSVISAEYPCHTCERWSFPTEHERDKHENDCNGAQPRGCPVLLQQWPILVARRKRTNTPLGMLSKPVAEGQIPWEKKKASACEEEKKVLYEATECLICLLNEKVPKADLPPHHIILIKRVKRQLADALSATHSRKSKDILAHAPSLHETHPLQEAAESLIGLVKETVLPLNGLPRQIASTKRPKRKLPYELVDTRRPAKDILDQVHPLCKSSRKKKKKDKQKSSLWPSSELPTNKKREQLLPPTTFNMKMRFADDLVSM